MPHSGQAVRPPSARKEVPIMFISRRSFTLGVSLAACSLPGLAAIKDINDAINKAGRQRMLTLRCAKAYIAQAAGVSASKTAPVLQKSIALFDQQLVELKAFAPSDAVRSVYQQLEPVWAEYKTALLGAAPSTDRARRVIALSEQILALSNKGTVQLEQFSGKPSGRLVNLSGRERMLSQRMATYYFVAAARIDPAAAAAEIARARTEFIANLQALRDAPQATPRIKSTLKLAESQWIFFDSALQHVDAAGQQRAQQELFIASENLLDVLNNVTDQYAALG